MTVSLVRNRPDDVPEWACGDGMVVNLVSTGGHLSVSNAR
jgi:hypothetical protein